MNTYSRYMTLRKIAISADNNIKILIKIFFIVQQYTMQKTCSWLYIEILIFR